jgi:3-oxoacyl-[acyl-carrier protein] reductase
MSEQRVAVITGASRGIGRSVALELAAGGVAVVIGYAGNAGLAHGVVDEITAAGGKAVAGQADVADEKAVGALFDLADRTYGGVDVVVNSAGVMVLSSIADLDLDKLDAMHRTNIRGAFVVAREAARRVRDGGSVVFVSTSQVGLQFPTYAGYAASKGAVETMTMVLAKELRGRHITVNTVAPGPTATDFFLDGKDDATIARMAQQPPLERLGTPDDMARVVAFLTAPGGWVNGQVLRANGGII